MSFWIKTKWKRSRHIAQWQSVWPWVQSPAQPHTHTKEFLDQIAAVILFVSLKAVLNWRHFAPTRDLAMSGNILIVTTEGEYELLASCESRARILWCITQLPTRRIIWPFVYVSWMMRMRNPGSQVLSIILAYFFLIQRVAEIPHLVTLLSVIVLLLLSSVKFH